MLFGSQGGWVKSVVALKRYGAFLQACFLCRDARSRGFELL